MREVRDSVARVLRRIADRLDGRWQGLPQHLQPRAAFQALQLRAWSCAVTVRIARIKGDREDSFNTASGVLIEFPERAVVATAWHVLEEFVRSRDSGQEVALVCDQLAMPNPRTVYRDETNDIAFIHLPSQGFRWIHASPYRPGPLWPPPQVKADDSVLVCGFPKKFRYDGEEILHGDFNVVVNVASASDSHFMLNIDWENLGHGGRIRLPKQQADYGGVSGGPVFLYNAGGNPLVGIVSQAGETLPIWRIAALSSVTEDIARTPSVPL